MSKVRAIPQYRGGPAISKFRTFARYRDGDIEFHDCPGLAKCPNHPRWSVVKNVFVGWIALPPGWYPKRVFGPESHRDRITHAEAITHARKEATK